MSNRLPLSLFTLTIAEPGDLILILSGDDTMKTRKQLCELRLEVASQLGLRDKNKFSCLWVVDFPLFEYSEEEGRYMAMHHPFTSPKPEDIPLLDTDMGAVRANAYDMIINGVEVGGGSIRIYDSELQNKMFALLGFTPERAQQQFGWLLDAFKYGAPPHGGLAYGLDRLVTLLLGLEDAHDVGQSAHLVEHTLPDAMELGDATEYGQIFSQMMRSDFPDEDTKLLFLSSGLCQRCRQPERNRRFSF